MTPRETAVLVAGAGPAGVVTAAELRRHGVDVLLVGDEPAGGAYDAVLSGPIMRTLATLDGGISGALRPIRAVDLRFDADGPSTSLIADAAACDDRRLRADLRRLVTARGGALEPGRLVSLDRDPSGWTARVQGEDRVRTVVARHVVLALGWAAGSPLLPPKARHAVGVTCARRYGGVDLGGRLILRPLPPSPVDPHDHPACVWAVPGEGPGTFTVGITAVGGGGADRPESLMASALETLAASDPRFAAAMPLGAVTSGPVNSGFAPEHAVRDGRLLVGDAAGLVNPFTGEGLGNALQSALVAARAIAENPADPEAARAAYKRGLAASFIGYFETARHAARRYHLAWRVLGATAGDDHPFYALGRRAMLMPDGVLGPFAGEASFSRRDALFVHPFLAACDEIAVEAVRREWPFIARILAAGPHRAVRVRPATLFLAALAAAGAVPGDGRAAVGAAMDLAALGSLTFFGPIRGAGPIRGVDWGAAVIVLACDFLLAQASRLVSRAAPEAAWAFSDWLAEMAGLRAAHLGGDPAVGAADLTACLFEFPARLGAELGGAGPETVARVREIGHQCGRAFLFAEDALALRGLRTRLDTTSGAMLAGRISTVPRLLGRDDLTAGELSADPHLRAAAVAAATAACRDAAGTALDLAAGVPHQAAARILRALVRAIAPPFVLAPEDAPPPAALRGEESAR
ncbi:FAD-dependent monooxygenase [Actinomadura sp. B10D3]|uniref:FAD-dependent monooxygenase n=1 Tax=Actinomadura sp. B10D3 TaxID=3153557 RepID=UPI00325DA371